MSRSQTLFAREVCPIKRSQILFTIYKAAATEFGRNSQTGMGHDAMARKRVCVLVSRDPQGRPSVYKGGRQAPVAAAIDPQIQLNPQQLSINLPKV